MLSKLLFVGNRSCQCLQVLCEERFLWSNKWENAELADLSSESSSSIHKIYFRISHKCFEYHLKDTKNAISQVLFS